MISKHNQEKPNSCFKIHNSLIQKYSTQFHFYFSKPVLQIVYNDKKSLTNILIKDQISFSDDTQYMNRIYNYFNSLGKQQIYQRIRLISSFYSDQFLQSQYPMMLLTKTQKIFRARQRRLRKMVASDGSSDESEDQNQDEQSFSSQGFLESVSSMPQQSSLASMFESASNQLSYQSQVHNIYENQSHIIQISENKNIKNVNQTILDHLIVDFQDFDIEKTLQNYNKIKEKTNRKRNQQNKLSLVNIASKKQVFQSIIINDHYPETKSINNNQINFHHKEANHIKKSQLLSQNQQQNYQRRKKASRARGYIEQRNIRRNSPYFQQIEDRDERRQKIRDKAAQLLLRVKRQNYLDGRPDYFIY